jgi:hypothetical protein
MLGKNNYYVVGDKKTFKTKENFIKEIYWVYEIKVEKENINKVWMRYSPLVENSYTGKGSYVSTKPNKRGSFECWEYQYN